MKLKDPNLIISLLALVVSLATLAYTIAHDRAEQREDLAIGVQEVLGDYQRLSRVEWARRNQPESRLPGKE
jgi:hypothetical protein